ncbi:MAG: hypothetical protein LJE65_06065 [Desulfobacteraceae bacterium]|nr:hypothetical protein [Desulfobacteraceae bacterium]
MTHPTHRDFWNLLLVCLKMFFRKTTRKRFAFLLAGSMLLMGYNTFQYVRQFRETEQRMNALLSDKAMQVYFFRCRTPGDLARLLHEYRKPLEAVGARIVNEAFLYQNNLFVHWPDSRKDEGDRFSDLFLLCDLFGVREAADAFRSDGKDSGHRTTIHPNYVDHNGWGLSPSIRLERQQRLKRDLQDLSDMIRGGLSGRRFESFQAVSRNLIDSVEARKTSRRNPPDPFLSRVNLVVPLNLLHILKNVADDTTTDVFDLADAVRIDGSGGLTVSTALLRIPSPPSGLPLYADILAYPRYIPVVMERLLAPRWHWMLFRQVSLQQAFMSILQKLHFSGNFLFSYEKSHVLREKVRQVDREIRGNHFRFYWTDLCLGILFPFMISLFAVIHLKSEFAFLLMFQNRIRQLLLIFWLLPLALVLVLKALTVAVALCTDASLGTAASAVPILLPMSISYLASAAVFYPVNRWCFNPFTGKRLNLYALHKGR